MIIARVLEKGFVCQEDPAAFDVTLAAGMVQGDLCKAGLPKSIFIREVQSIRIDRDHVGCPGSSANRLSTALTIRPTTTPVHANALNRGARRTVLGSTTAVTGTASSPPVTELPARAVVDATTASSPGPATAASAGAVS